MLQMLFLHLALEVIDQSTVCIFFTSEFFSSFLKRDFFELQSSPQLESRTSPSGLCGTRFVRHKCHMPSLGIRRATAPTTEMPVLMLQHGDFFDYRFVAAASVLGEGFAAGGELRGSFSYRERLVRVKTKHAFLNGSALTGYCSQRDWPACRQCRECCLCSRCPCHECVLASDGCKSLWLRMTF